MEKIFINAARNKYRFPFKGQITVEDLWDLTVVNLDSIYRILNSQLKTSKEDSLLTTKNTEDKILEEKIEIIKYIATVKQTEAKKKEDEKAVKAQNARIREIIASKKDAALLDKSVEELQAMLVETDE